jgi:hypothetical protein
MKLIACKCSRGSAGSERGQAILEFVPVMILMLTMTFAVVDFSYLIWQHQIIIGLTREGSNLASRDTSLALAAKFQLCHHRAVFAWKRIEIRDEQVWNLFGKRYAAGDEFYYRHAARSATWLHRVCN